MINTMIFVIITYSIWVMINSKNPMKTSFFILISSSAMFLYTKLNSGTTWMPLIFFILFTGGILMMFMILSSILPNEKTLKVKYSKFVTIVILTFLMCLPKPIHQSMLASSMKSFLSSGLNLMFMTTIILLYFFNSINLNSEEDTPMRSLQC